ncbi:MAG: hypothetical protein J5589_11150 [Firmicutes bacterium]|nr:hypothetical protein [Bacillota bacterium]
MKNCIRSNDRTTDKGRWWRKENRRNSTLTKGLKLGAILLAVCVLFQAFLLPETAHASEMEGVTVRQVLTNEQGRIIEPEEDGAYHLAMMENDGFIRTRDNIQVREIVTMNLSEMFYGYDNIQYLLAANGAKTMTLILRLDPVLAATGDVEITSGNADLISYNAHDGYVTIAMNVRESLYLTVEVTARIYDRSYEALAGGYELQSRLSAIMWGGIVLNDEPIKTEKIRVIPTLDETVFELSGWATDLDRNFTSSVAMEIGSLSVSPMDMVVIEDDHTDATIDLDTSIQQLKGLLTSGGINLHEGILPVNGRPFSEVLDHAVEELILISRSNALKYVVVLTDGLDESEEQMLVRLSQQHSDYHIIVKKYPTADSGYMMEDMMRVLADELMVTLKAGSTVEGYFAPGFVMVTDPEKVTLTIDGNTINAVPDDIEYGETYCFAFGDNYKLHYYGPEWEDYPYFVLEIGEDKVAGEAMTLRFQTRLVDPERPEKSGITYYGTYDPYGLAGYEGIDVMASVQLKAKNLLGEVAEVEYFPIPTVGYTALRVTGQYGTEEVFYFTADQVGTVVELTVDDQLYTVSVSSDGFHTIPEVE